MTTLRRIDVAAANRAQVEEALGLLIQQLYSPVPPPKALETLSGKFLCHAVDNLVTIACQYNHGIARDRNDALLTLLESLEQITGDASDKSEASALAHARNRITFGHFKDIQSTYGRESALQLIHYIHDLNMPHELAARNRLTERLSGRETATGRPSLPSDTKIPHPL